MKMRNIIALVTGGASGLGAASASRFVDSGAKVVILDCDNERGLALAEHLGDHARFAAADVTNESDVQAALDMARREFGGLNAIINCAGVGLAIRTTSSRGAHPLDLFETVIRVNLIGAFNVIRLAATIMAGNEANSDGERGVIVNTASVAAFDGQIGQAAYSASKGGIVGMTLPIARDLAAQRHPRLHHCAGHLRYTPARQLAGSGTRNRWESKCPSRHGSVSQRNLRNWLSRSWKTPCSMARPFAWTARCACKAADRP